MSKKLIFDPEGNPDSERLKWHDEIMRLEGEGYNGNNPKDMSALQEARKNYRYFSKQSLSKKGTPAAKEEEPEKGGKISQGKYRKPWPGWGKALEKL